MVSVSIAKTYHQVKHKFQKCGYMKPEIISKEVARKLLNHWSSKGFFRARNLGESAKIQNISNLLGFKITLKTQYEYRSVSHEVAPYRGGSIDSGTSPEICSIDVSTPKDFADQSQRVKLPKSERVAKCDYCKGLGITSCSNCNGKGQTSCTFCSGTRMVNCFLCGGVGLRTEYQSRTEYVFNSSTQQNETRYVNEPVWVPCYSCGGVGRKICGSCGGSGKRTCANCSGSGRLNCGTCQGYRRVKIYDVLTVNFQHDEQIKVIHQSNIPDSKLFQASGHILVNEDCLSIESLSGLPQEVTSSALDLISNSKEKGGKIHFQHLMIQAVDVHQIIYRLGKNTIRSLWVYGREKLIFSMDKPPLAWVKIILTAILILALIITVIYLVTMLIPIL